MDTVTVAIFAALLGAVVGSFANVVVYRLPRKESIVFPGSRCPNCGRQLGFLDLIPVFSYLLLRGRCRSCAARISPRYPIVELLMAALFLAIVLRWPPLDVGPAAITLLVVVAMLVMAALIDLEHFILPDSLTITAIVLGLLGALLHQGAGGLPAPQQALIGALAGAGLVVLINRIGALVLRRFRDTKERLWPVGLDQVNVAAAVGTIGGAWVGVAAGAASVMLNLVLRRGLRLGEPLIYAVWLATLVAAVLLRISGLPTPLAAIGGGALAAGAWALLGATYWWLHDLTKGEPEAREEEDEPVAMGFGDVKLMAALGALLGWEKMLLGFLLAVVLGAIGGVIARLGGGSRVVPFGPYLLAGGLVALFFGGAILDWYLAMLELP